MLSNQKSNLTQITDTISVDSISNITSSIDSISAKKDSLKELKIVVPSIKNKFQQDSTVSPPSQKSTLESSMVIVEQQSQEDFLFPFYEIEKDTSTISILAPSKPVDHTKYYIPFFSLPSSQNALSFHQRNVTTQEWFSVILLGVFVFFVGIKYFFKKQIHLLYHTFSYNKSSQMLFKEQHILIYGTMFAFFIAYLIVSTLFFYQLINYYTFSFFQFNDIQLFSILLLSLIVVYSCKIIILKIIGMIFKTQTTTSEYIFSILLFNNVVGIILFPIVICIAYFSFQIYKILFFIGISIIILLFTLRLARGFFIGSVNKFSHLHLFLYICGLEFLPLIVMIKVLMRFH